MLPGEAVRDRALGALLGVAAGDSLGATYEFAAPNRGEPQRDIVGGGAFRWKPGEPTDDTDLTMAVMRAYRDASPDATKDDLIHDIAGRFIDWQRSGPRDIGGTTSGAIGRLRRGVDPDESGATHDASAANGSLMRCIATGIARNDPNERADETARISAITHAEPRCIDACVAYNDIVGQLLDGAAPRNAIRTTMERWTFGDETLTAIAEQYEQPDSPMPWTHGGYVLTALAIAVWAIQQPRSAEDLIIEVANHGGDADTNGAIAGGLVGARDGAAAIPQRWKDVLHVTAEVEGSIDTLLNWRQAEVP